MAGRCGGALRLRPRDLSALLGRRDVLVLDTETTGVGPAAEVIEVIAIDTTGALRLSALALPVGPISRGSWELHGLSEAALHAMGARPWAEVHPELLSTRRNAAAVLAWRADFDARVLAQTAALRHRVPPPVAWADVRPAYVKARPGGRHSLADAMCREGLAWGRAPSPRRSRLPGGARPDARPRQRLTGTQAGECARSDGAGARTTQLRAADNRSHGVASGRGAGGGDCAVRVFHPGDGIPIQVGWALETTACFILVGNGWRRTRPRMGTRQCADWNPR